MDWIATVGDTALQSLAWLAILAAAFALLVRWMPCNRGMYWWKDWRAAGTNLLYWFVTPLFVRIARTLMLAGAATVLFGGAAPGFALVRELPLWQQCIACLLIQDVMLYWIHRVFHMPLAWNFHSVHHSSGVLDWMSASRNHFVNLLLSFILADVVVLLLGFAPAALLALAPFNILYASMVHANLNWTFGPFRYVFASPVFHRWHHTTDRDSLNKNFASTFPILDLVFGTFYMPADRLPEHFGNGELDYPDDFWGQLIQPFVKMKPTLAVPLESKQRSPSA